MRKMNRKEFIQASGLATAGILFSPEVILKEVNLPKIRAIAFDAFPIFDPRPIFKKVNEIFPEKGKEIGETWKATQFAYQWLRVSANQYKDFFEITKDALDFTLEQFKITATPQEKVALMEQYASINVWPDVVAGLQVLKEKNLKLGFLSNMTAHMLRQGIGNSGTKDLFDFVISTDEGRTFKPSPQAYQLGIDSLRLKKEEILFVAFAGWDASGAKWFGYPTFWLNRLNATTERLDVKPDGMGNGFASLIDFVVSYNRD